MRLARYIITTSILLSAFQITVFLSEGDGACCHARKVSTTLRNPDSAKKGSKNNKKARKDEEIVVPSSADSLEWARSIVFAGYDKPAVSGSESFFISNNTERTIRAIEVEITYLDTKGRMLHQRQEYIRMEIPAAETRKVDIKSFDTQHSFYYVKSNAPAKRATPFDTRMVIRAIYFAKQFYTR